MDINIRNAKKKDMKRVHELIMELAKYEKLPEEVDISTNDLINDCFGKNKLFNCFVAEVNSACQIYYLYPNFGC